MVVVKVDKKAVLTVSSMDSLTADKKEYLLVFLLAVLLVTV